MAAPFLPLEAIAFDVDVTGPIARVEVRETFRNRTADVLDAVYVSALPPGGAVDALSIRIGTREIRGVIQRRDDARRAFEEARDAGRTAALAEEQPHAVFTQDVANLPPGAAVEVALTVVAPLERHDGSWSLALPLAAPPRFLPLGAGTSLPPPDPRDTGVRADVELSVQAGTAVRSLWATPLPRDVRPDLLGSAARLHLPGLPLGEDLAIGWTTARDAPTTALLTTPDHVMWVGEDGRGERAPQAPTDWGGCPVADVVTRRGGGATYVWGRRLGACEGPVRAGGLEAWPRAAVDPRGVDATWARGRVGSGLFDAEVEALGLAWGIVTPRTSLVAVDSAGPVAAAAARPPSPWNPSGLFATDLPDTTSTSAGLVVSKEYLQRIPTGRSYQNAIEVVGGSQDLGSRDLLENTYLLDGANVGDPVTGTFSMNFNYDALTSSVPPPVATTRGLARPPDAAPGPWRLRAQASGFGGAAPGGSGGARVDGPLAGAASAAVSAGRWPGVDVSDAAGSVAWVGNGAAPTVQVGGGSGSGSGTGFGHADLRAGVGRDAQGVLNASRRWLGGDAADRATVAAAGEGPAGAHRLGAAAEVGWLSRAGEGAVVGEGQVGDRFGRGLGRLDLAVGAAGLGDRWTPTGALAAQVGRSATLAARAVRATDPERATADALPVDERLGATVRASGAHTVALEADWVHQVAVRTLPLALDPAGTAWGTVSRVFPELRVGWERPVARRWSGSASARWHPTAPGLRAPWATDPLSAFVPGLLDPLRRWTVRGEIGWDLPTDPYPLGIGVQGEWAEAIDPLGPWWLRAAGAVGATLRQDLPVRGGVVSLRAGVSFARHDLARAPVPAQALLPGGAALDAVQGLRAEGGLSVDF